MRITSQDGGDVSSAKVTSNMEELSNDDSCSQVGDPLALRFEILDKRSPYEIFVRELVAMDGLDTSEILLIDSLGKIVDDNDDKDDEYCDNPRLPHRLQHHAVLADCRLGKDTPG